MLHLIGLGGNGEMKCDTLMVEDITEGGSPIFSKGSPVFKKPDIMVDSPNEFPDIPEN